MVLLEAYNKRGEAKIIGFVENIADAEKYFRIRFSEKITPQKPLCRFGPDAMLDSAWFWEKDDLKALSFDQLVVRVREDSRYGRMTFYSIPRNLTEYKLSDVDLYCATEVKVFAPEDLWKKTWW